MANAHLVVRLCTYPDAIVLATAQVSKGEEIRLGTAYFNKIEQILQKYDNILKGISQYHAVIQSCGNGWVVKEMDGNIYDCLLDTDLTINMGNYFLIGEQSYIIGFLSDDATRLIYCQENEDSQAIQLHSVHKDNTFVISKNEGLMNLNDKYFTQSASVNLSFANDKLSVKRDFTYKKGELKDEVWILKKEIPLIFATNTRRLFRIGKIVVAVDIIFGN